MLTILTLMEGLKKEVLIQFSTKHLSSTEKVKFHYAFKGRNGSAGLIDQTKSNHIGSCVVMAPHENHKELLSFFDHWNVPYESTIIFKEEEQ